MNQRAMAVMSVFLLLLSFPYLLTYAQYQPSQQHQQNYAYQQQQQQQYLSYEKQYPLNKPQCMHRYSSCYYVQNGNYQFCEGCELGEYLRCHHGYGTILKCPYTDPPKYQNYQSRSSYLVPLIYDPHYGYCVRYSTSCQAYSPNNYNYDGYSHPLGQMLGTPYAVPKLPTA